MLSTKWKETAELFGLIAIIASLIFVGLEIKQGREIALADYYQTQTVAAMSHFDTMIQAQITGVADQRFSDEGRTPNDERARYWSTHWDWASLENLHYQYQAGFLTDEAWVAAQSRMQQIFGRCEMRMVYETRKGTFRPSFVAAIESLDDPC